MLLTILRRVVPPVAGAFGWYTVTRFVQDTASISEHSDWIIGIMGAIISFALGLIGYLSSKSIQRIETDIAQLRVEVHEINQKVNSHAEDLAVLNTKHNRRKKK